MERQWVIVHCRTAGCKNLQALHPDSWLPVEGQWECSACEDALEEQMAVDLARRADVLAVRRMNEAQNGTAK
jgi:hypothetical protein